MRQDLQLLSRWYELCLQLFPKKYRENYGEELQAVFGLSLEEAARKGGMEVERLVLRELLSLPKAIVLEHMRERRHAKMTKTFDSHFHFVPGSWKEFLAALLPFFLVGVAMPSLSYLIRSKLIQPSGIWGAGIPLALFGLFLILLVFGLKMGMPRWSLPYLGFLLSILSVYLFSFILGTPIYFLFRNFRDSSLLMDVIWDGIFWYGLLTGMICLTALTRASAMFERFRSDWTQLAFIVYGAVPFALWLTFDEYIGDELYTLLLFLVLAGGAWFYLRSKSEWKRFGLLFSALTLAMLIATVAKLILIPSQDWANPLNTSLANSDAKHTVIMWGWFALCMLVSLGGRMLPSSDVSSDASPSGA